MAATTPSGLTRGAQLLVEGVERLQKQAGVPEPWIEQWLAIVAEQQRPLAEALVPGLDVPGLLRGAKEKLAAGAGTHPLAVAMVLVRAGPRAASRGSSVATLKDVVASILEVAGHAVLPDGAVPTAGVPPSPPTFGGPPHGGTAAASTPSAEPAVEVAPPAAGAWRPVAKRPTPTLEQFGRDLTGEALAGKLPPVVGRDGEIDLVIETLCRRTKRNPALVGAAGVGKTAIVEGLAQRIVAGNVPAVLKGSRLLAIQPSTVVAGAKMVGDLESRMKAIVAEASQEGVLLFVDEVHSMVGAGGAPGTGDVASQLKPALARGDLALIAATTDDEYRRFIEPDTALERRFQPIRVHELTPEETMAVLVAVREAFARKRGIAVEDDVLRWILGFAASFMRNRRFPDKAIDLLDQCVAFALTRGQTTVERKDAEAVASRMVGRPAPAADGAKRLRERLLAAAPLHAEDVDALATRLEVTTRSLDIRPHRPNLVMLLAGDAATYGGAVSEALAEALSGSPDRVVGIDCSRFVHREDVTMLVGAPPGYVGYQDALPLHRVSQMPWCVLLLQGIDVAHPQVREVVTQALANGYFTDGHGRRIWLSDAEVVLTSGAGAGVEEPLGFGRAGEEDGGRDLEATKEALGVGLLDQVDVVCARVARSPEAKRRFIEGRLLAGLADRWREQGVRLVWDESLVAWVLERPEASNDPRAWERALEESLGPAILGHLKSAGDRSGDVSLRVSCEGGTIRVGPS